MDEVTRWTVNAAPETDSEVRTCIVQRATKKGDLPKVIDVSVEWRLLDLTLTEARSRFDDLARHELDLLVAEAVKDARRH